MSADVAVNQLQAQVASPSERQVQRKTASLREDDMSTLGVWATNAVTLGLRCRAVNQQQVCSTGLSSQ